MSQHLQHPVAKAKNDDQCMNLELIHYISSKNNMVTDKICKYQYHFNLVLKLVKMTILKRMAFSNNTNIFQYKIIDQIKFKIYTFLDAKVILIMKS